MSKIVLTAQLICQERVSCLNVIGAAQIVEEAERGMILWMAIVRGEECKACVGEADF